MERLLRTLRTQVVLALLRPYTRVRLPWLARRLNVPEPEVEALLVGLILDGKVRGRIDQVNRLLLLRGHAGGGGAGGAGGGGGGGVGAGAHAGPFGGRALGGHGAAAGGGGAGGAQGGKHAAVEAWVTQLGELGKALMRKAAAASDHGGGMGPFG